MYGSSFARHVRKASAPHHLMRNAFMPSAVRQATMSTHARPRWTLPCLDAHEVSHGQHADHVRRVWQQLEQTGILKIALGFPDNNSEYLHQLLLSIHKHHKHQLPISHSAVRGWFWDVRPSETSYQAGIHQARSETMQEFPWHTDCSYEDPPPRFFALQVLQHDRYGGGTLSVMNVERLSEFLCPATVAALEAPEYEISTPAEFVKNPDRQHVTGALLATSPDGRPTMIRYREDIVLPLTARAAWALERFKDVLTRDDVQARSTMHLTSADLPKGSVILLDNRRWLHARNNIHDPERHLRRVRWDACRFGGTADGHL